MGTEGDRGWGTMQVLGLVASLGAGAFLGARVVQATYRKKWSIKIPNPAASAVERHLFSASALEQKMSSHRNEQSMC